MSVTRAVMALIRATKGWWLASALSASVLYYLFPLAPPLIVKELIDRLDGAPVFDSGVTQLLLLLVGIFTARGLTFMAAGYAEQGSTAAAGTLIRRNALAGVLRQPAARALPASTGDAVSRLSNDSQRLTALYTYVADPIGQLAALGVTFFVLADVSATLTLLVAVPVLVAALIINMAGRRIEGIRKVLQEALGARSGVLGDLYSGVAAIQLGGAQRAAVGYLAGANEKVRKATLRDILIGGAIQDFGYNLGRLGTAVFLFMSAGRIRSGDISIGELALFIAYLDRLTDVAGQIGSMTTHLRLARVSLGRLAEMAPDEPARMVTAKASIHLRRSGPAVEAAPLPENHRLDELRVNDLTCVHGETAAGIRDLDLVVRRGTVTVITGEVGAGKTTLLRAVLGLLPVQRGEVLWNGEPVVPALDLVPPRVAYSPQVPRCFTATLSENIRLGHPADDEAVRAALHAAVMEDDLTQLPDGLDTEVGPRGLRLSGGQLLRASAARMFVRQPELMVVDDLSSGLDVDTEAELWRRLRVGGGTWLIVSHRPAALALADQVVLLDNGRVTACGPPDQLRDHPFIAHIRSGSPAAVS